MAQSDRLYLRVDEGLGDDVERYQDREGVEHKSDAVRELVEIGLREQRQPLLWRAKDRVTEWVSLLSIAAVMVFALGAGTHIYPLVDGIRAAVLMLTLAAALLGCFETARLLAGMNRIGVRAREMLAAAATVVSGGGE